MPFGFDGFTALHVASRLGCIEVAKFLLDKIINMNTRNFYCIPLRFTCRHGQLEMVDVLLDRGADLTTLLFLNQKGASKEWIRSHGWAPFQLACQKDDLNSDFILLAMAMPPSIFSNLLPRYGIPVIAQSFSEQPFRNSRNSLLAWTKWLP